MNAVLKFDFASFKFAFCVKNVEQTFCDFGLMNEQANVGSADITMLLYFYN